MNAVANRARFEFLLRAGDNDLVLGQRLTAWIGHAPVLEEELGLANVALDLIGQARMWLSYAGETEAAGRGEDELAYFRDAGEFRNVLLVEQRNGDYAETTVRQFLFDAWHHEVLGAWSSSSDPRVAEIARKARREVEYHVLRSGEWVVRLGDGTEESHARTVAAVERLWPFTGELFRSDDTDRELAAAGIAAAPETLQPAWLARVARVFAEATLEVPAAGWMHGGGRSGRHTEQLGYVLAEMQSLRRSVPGERW